ncbi:glycosyltransferase [bacterium]|nr:glycosyltransferase [bacterium]
MSIKSNKKLKVASFTNISPHYRNCLWQVMVADSEIEFHFFFGKPIREGIKVIDFNSADWKNYLNRIHYVRNIRIGGLLIWQFGVIKEVFKTKWNALIFLGDFHIISTWIAAILARILHKPVYYWTHGVYGNESKLKFLLRRIFLSIANRHFIYGNYSKNLLIDSGFDASKLYVVNNSLDYDRHLQIRNRVIDNNYYSSRQFFKNPTLPILIFIGRLTPQKKLELLIHAVKRLNAEKDSVNLIVIGDGPMKEKISDLSAGFEETIHLYGPSYDESEIGFLVANASLCVSPGNVGLTAIHSLSFGTPVVTHNNFSNQMPEFEAIEEGVTGAFFEENSIESLVKTVDTWMKKKSLRESEIINACHMRIDSLYNPHYQLSMFKSALL